MKTIILAAVLLIALIAEGQGYYCGYCPGPNEVYLECGPSCERTCATLYDVCDIYYIRCPSGCYCIDGYARDEYGTCIPIEYCPPCYYY